MRWASTVKPSRSRKAWIAHRWAQRSLSVSQYRREAKDWNWRKIPGPCPPLDRRTEEDEELELRHRPRKISESLGDKLWCDDRLHAATLSEPSKGVKEGMTTCQQQPELSVVSVGTHK